MDFGHRWIFMLHSFWHPLVRKSWEVVFMEYQCMHNTDSLSCLWIFTPPDKLWLLHELSLHHECHKIIVVFFMSWKDSWSSEQKCCLQREYLKWCTNESLTELLITDSFRPINVFTTTTVPGISKPLNFWDGGYISFDLKIANLVILLEIWEI